MNEVTMGERLVHTLRSMAWQRAKGELRGMCHTFYIDSTHDDRDAFERFEKKVDAFIKDMENSGLEE